MTGAVDTSTMLAEEHRAGRDELAPHSLPHVAALDLTVDRRLRDLRQIVAALQNSPMSPLQVCEAIINDRVVDPCTREFFSGLPANEKHYWVSSLYALLMPKGRRQRLAAYFTPPHLVSYVLDIMLEQGIEPGKHRILDPASGGAAFLVPLAAWIAQNARQKSIPAETILQSIELTLAGIEIEPQLAKLSHTLLADLLRPELTAARRSLNISITRTSTLKLETPDTPYDAVIGNPPYGRVFRPSDALLSRFADVITDGYVNLYALFIEQALRWVRPGGLICLIVPMSFIGGAYFAALRKRILEVADVLRVDPIDKRSDLFVDVLYDVCVLVLRKRGADACVAKPASALLLPNEPPRNLGTIDLPDGASDRIWALPDGALSDEFFQDGLETLEDYGYLARSGYFVWNRERDRYRTGFKPRSTEVPLFWAHNVVTNSICEPLDRDGNAGRIGFVKIAHDSTAVVKTDAILLQRTSNRRQRRRIIAGIIRKSKLPSQRGFVSENHTILIIPDPAKKQVISLKMLCRLLNTEAVDARFRRISGSVSVSTKTLRQLPLPAVKEVRSAFVTGASDEEAAERAYARSVSSKARENSVIQSARGVRDVE